MTFPKYIRPWPIQQTFVQEKQKSKVDRIRNWMELGRFTLEHSSLGGLNKKKHEKKHKILAFKLLFLEIWLKNLTSREIFWSSNI